MRPFLRSLLPLLAALSPALAWPAPSAPPVSWGVNTNIDIWPSYASSAADAIAHVGPLAEGLGARIVREGMQADMHGNNLDPIDWSLWFDAWVDWLDEHRMQLILQLNLNGVRNDHLAYDDAWEKRIVHKCREAARYVDTDPKRRRVVAWFLLINEPDLKTGIKGGLLTPARLVRVHELAWQTIKAVNPDLLIEGLSFGDGAGIGASFPLRAFNLNTGIDDETDKAPPTAGKSVPGMISKDVFDLGITRYCDLIGYHNYVEISEDNRFGSRALLENMYASHEKSGFPIRPIVNTETGCHDTQLNRIGGVKGKGLKPVDVSDEARYTAIAHWQQLNRVQLARFGVSRAVYFTLGGDSAPWMYLVNYPAAAGQKLYSRRPSYASEAAAMQPRPLATLNGGFEQPEDKFSNWVVLYNPHNFRSPDLEYGEWKQAHFQHDGRQAAPGAVGTGYLQLDAGLPKFVRRVVDGLEPGRTYRASVWVRQDAAAKATLAVYGFNQNDPQQSVASATGRAGEWIRLAVEFTPRRSIVGVDGSAVLSLEHDGQAASWWDEASLVPLP